PAALHFSMLLPPHPSTLFPYTTLFRSHRLAFEVMRDADRRGLEDCRVRRGSRLDLRGTYALPGYFQRVVAPAVDVPEPVGRSDEDRKSTRLNSSHQIISYAVFCLKKKT